MKDKQYFTDALNSIWTLIRHERAINDALCALDPDFGGFSMSPAISLCADMLAKMYNDKYEYIDYFLFELDFGTDESYYDNEDGTPMHESDGTPIPLRTPEDLYNLIISDQEDKYKALYENEKSKNDTLKQLLKRCGLDHIGDDEADAILDLDNMFTQILGANWCGGNCAK